MNGDHLQVLDPMAQTIAYDDSCLCCQAWYSSGQGTVRADKQSPLWRHHLSFRQHEQLNALSSMPQSDTWKQSLMLRLRKSRQFSATLWITRSVGHLQSLTLMCWMVLPQAATQLSIILLLTLLERLSSVRSIVFQTLQSFRRWYQFQQTQRNRRRSLIVN